MGGKSWLRASLMVVVTGVTASGCSLLESAFCGYSCGESRSGSSSSLVGFLYPGGELPPAEDAVPEVRVPMRVGLTFLPSSSYGEGIDPAQREAVLERIRQRFQSRKFIGEIVVIPDYYLVRNGTRESGFDSLAAVQRLYNLDVLALVSHDQVTYRDDNALSFTYLTIVGAYIVPGSRHEVTTLVDLAVVEPRTRSLLLRAGGTDSQERTTTLVDAQAVARGSRQKSFAAASEQMIEHFDVALARFEENVRTGEAQVKVSRRDGGAGGGSLDVIVIVAALALLAARLRRRATPVARPVSRRQAR